MVKVCVERNGRLRVEKEVILIAEHCSYFEHLADIYILIDILINKHILSYIAVIYEFF